MKMRPSTSSASQFGVHPTQIGQWKRQLLDGAVELFSDDRRRRAENQDVLIAELYEVGGEDRTPDVADRIKEIGFTYATRSGYSIAVSDITVPPEKQEIINQSLKEVELVQRDFRRGLLTEQEQKRQQLGVVVGLALVGILVLALFIIYFVVGR